MVKGVAFSCQREGAGAGNAPVTVLVEQPKGLDGLGDLHLAHAFDGRQPVHGEAVLALGHGTSLEDARAKREDDPAKIVSR